MAARALSGGASTGWRERWIGWRNALISDPRFQRWASSSPLTRLIARRRARALFDLCAGFVYSQVLLACVRLRLCEHLVNGPLGVADIARLIDLSPEAATRLLRAAASLRLVRALPGERYALDDLGASLIGNPSVAGFVEHHILLYDDLRDPVALLRGEISTSLSRFWPYARDEAPGRSPDESVPPYSALMSRSQALLAPDILDAYPVSRHIGLLDVGGGEGGFLIEAAARAPKLELKLFDLPPVVERARLALSKRGLSGRVETTGGNFFKDPLPRGADIITLVRIVHDHDDAAAVALMRAAWSALPPGGTLLIAEPMADTIGAEAIGDAYFGFYLLAMGSGRPRRFDELQALLEKAGFSQIQAAPTRRPILASIIVARKV
jgi:demethylspheroidene O-methyltransferase